MLMKQKIKFDPQFKHALDKLENSDKHVFLTGHAGTGKSTLLDYFRNKTKKNVAVVAPTGVAALNVKGQTIHSFFGFRPDVTVENVQRFYRRKGKKGLFKKLDAIIIDEISMVRADLLDCIDAFLRMHGQNLNLPFGGVQMILIGDLHQLPPVVTRGEKDVFSSFYQSPYFFSAHVFEQLDLAYIELKKIYRQEDKQFIKILSSIRNDELDDSQLTLLNTRHDPQFETPANDFYIHLTTTNRKAQQINDYHLSRSIGKKYSYQGSKSGKFTTKALPTSELLEVKIGAQIMMVANDRDGRWVNGSLGKIVDIKEDPDFDDGEDMIMVELADGNVVKVTPYTWEMFKINYNPATNKLQTETTGSYEQYPLRLAWAITIHKSQGKTFDNVVIDFSWGTFAHGQAYVALSRCTSLEGLVMSTAFKKEFIKSDSQVRKFLTTFRYFADEEDIGENKEEVEGEGDMVIEALKIIINQALESGSLVTFTDADNTRRTVKPEKLVLGDSNQLVGYCYTVGEKVEFELTEIRELRELRGVS